MHSRYSSLSRKYKIMPLSFAVDHLDTESPLEYSSTLDDVLCDALGIGTWFVVGRSFGSDWSLIVGRWSVVRLE